MTKEELEVEIKRTEIDIELTKEFIEFNKKEDKRIILVSILAFIAVALINIEAGNSNFASMLTQILLVCYQYQFSQLLYIA